MVSHVYDPTWQGRRMLLWGGIGSWDGYSKQRVHDFSLADFLPEKKRSVSSSRWALLSLQDMRALFSWGFWVFQLYSIEVSTDKIFYKCILPQFLCASNLSQPSCPAYGLTRLKPVHQPRLLPHLRLEMRFKAHSGHWQNSVLWDYRPYYHSFLVGYGLGTILNSWSQPFVALNLWLSIRLHTQISKTQVIKSPR